MLVGYLNNINSDRRLIGFCSDSLSIRLFLRYDIDDSLPWHSTISRTRQLYGEGVFLELFQKVLRLCVEKGMVRGRRQAVDSAFIKANASLDSLVEKEVMNDVESYAEELNEGSEYKVSKARKKQVDRHHAWKAKAYKDMPGNVKRPKRMNWAMK
ncbi:MAG: transposase [Saprospiraceae bacterium]|nr:transposase [Saprospiraceae bacterium]